MQAIFKFYIPALIICTIILAVHTHSANAADIRKAAKAGSWYPEDPLKIREDIETLTRLAQQDHITLPVGKLLKALILPHAGYQYSGLTAAHAALVLTESNFSRIILMGPDHYIGFKHAAVSDAAVYETPLGRVKIHKAALKLTEQSSLFQPLSTLRDNEHSLEMVLLFLQSYIKNFELIPIVFGPAKPQSFADVLEPLLDNRTLIVVSSDLSHFLPYSNAVSKDNRTINKILDIDLRSLIKDENAACGIVPITILLEIARRQHWQPVLLNYLNSGDTAGDRTRVVGYAAIAFFGDASMQNKKITAPSISAKQGRVLLKLARHTLMEEFGQTVPETESEALNSALQDSCFQSKHGTFVTLKLKGQLRGCIGSLTSFESLSNGVKKNARNAAFHDPRFPPLTSRELDRVQIEISILTEPKPLAYNEGSELITKLQAGEDGVIIRKGYASATFLPQVWEQLPQHENFLSQLCMKAGLSSDAWQKGNLEVLTYQVQYFEEN